MMRIVPAVFWVCLLTAISAQGGGFPPSLDPGCLEPDENNTDLFCPGDLGYGCYKIPTMLQTFDGTLLAMIEARKFSCDDHGYVDLVLRRSTDQGETWLAPKLMYSNSTDAHWTTVGDGNFVQDTETGKIWLLHTRNNSHLFISFSDDDGLTWSSPVNVTTTLKKNIDGSVGTGHDGGRQLSAGPHKGRILIPTYSGGPYTIYSDDHGVTWKMGDLVPAEHYAEGSSAGEWTLAETGSFTEEGTPILLGSVRNSPNIPEDVTGKGFRLQSLSRDGGVTWGDVWEVNELPEPIRGCEGSMVFHPATQKLYFSHPDPSLGLFRNTMKIWSSGNMGATWEDHTVVWKLSAGYSSMVVLNGTGDIGIFYDRNNHSMAIFEAQGSGDHSQDLKQAKGVGDLYAGDAGIYIAPKSYRLFFPVDPPSRLFRSAGGDALGGVMGSKFGEVPGVDAGVVASDRLNFRTYRTAKTSM